MAVTTPIFRNTPQVTSFVNNGFCTDTNGGIQFPLQQGVPMQSIYVWNVIPAQNVGGCIVDSWQPAIPNTGGSYAPLETTATVGGGLVTNVATPITYLGNPCLLLDCERDLYCSVLLPADEDLTITITGYDYRGVEVVSEFTLDEGETAASSPKMFSIIKSIFLEGSSAYPLSVGTGTNISLPYYAVSENQIMGVLFDNTIVSGAFTPGYDWRLSAPTITSSSARPYIAVDTDGTSQLTVFMFVYGADSETNANISNFYAPALASYSIQETASSTADTPIYAFPYLTPYDLVGLQYPGNSDFIEIYTNALAS